MKENQSPLYVAKYNQLIAYTKLYKSVAKRKLKKHRKQQMCALACSP